jgi:uncharacterized damage-inducible protein DinB
MDLLEQLLDSWDRQARIVKSVASKIDESNRHLKPSEDGWPLDHQLAHIHLVRRFWLSNVDPERSARLQSSFSDGWETPITDLDLIKSLLDDSAREIRESVREMVTKGSGKVGGYDNPVLFLQHMVWHEGWHVGLIFLALRLAGQEPTDEWSEQHVWGEWRIEEF